MPGPNALGPRGILTEEEKANMPKVTKGLILRILSYLKPYRWQFLLVFVTIIVSAVVGLLPSIITGRIVDDALVGQDMALVLDAIQDNTSSTTIMLATTGIFGGLLHIVSWFALAWSRERKVWVNLALAMANFAFELVMNILLSPVVVRLLDIWAKNRQRKKA